jgi:shikimate dehydrogenase
MHNAAFAALGLNWRYVACDVDPKNLRAAIAGAQGMGFVGLNLTVPHKVPALDMVDVLDVSAKTWGAVNTIHFGDQGAIGFNTDANAIITSLREDLAVELPGARVLQLGVGGAGRTAALKLASEHVAELFIVNRTQAKAEEIAAEIRRQFPAVMVCTAYPSGDVDLVLNATSLGLQPGDPLPLDERQFPLPQARAVYDMVYRPAETPLLQAACAAGCRTANGLGMLLHQGARAFALWTGQTPPLDVMRHALIENVYGPAMA